MRSLLVFLAAVGFCHARPGSSSVGDLHPVLMNRVKPYQIRSIDAAPGEFPYQLSMQRSGAGGLSHYASATLLSANYGMTAAHLVDGALPSTMQVVAGLYLLTDTTGTQATDLSGYTMHESYGVGTASFANDIAILNFATPIALGGNIQAAVLPPDNGNDYAGLTCLISGWGDNIVLQKGEVEVISTAQCDAMMAGVIGANIWESQICTYDTAGEDSLCEFDSGSPVTCPDDASSVVAGVGSWSVSSGGSCLPSYPSVFTRTSSYLGWIEANTP